MAHTMDVMAGKTEQLKHVVTLRHAYAYPPLQTNRHSRATKKSSLRNPIDVRKKRKGQAASYSPASQPSRGMGARCFSGFSKVFFGCSRQPCFLSLSISRFARSLALSSSPSLRGPNLQLCGQTKSEKTVDRLLWFFRPRLLPLSQAGQASPVQHYIHQPLEIVESFGYCTFSGARQRGNPARVSAPNT